MGYEHFNSPNNNIHLISLLKNIYCCLLLVTVFSVSFSQEVDPDGYNVFYFENGDIASEGRFEEGIPVGIWKSYYQGGLLKSQGNKTKGQNDGVWQFFDSKGRITKEFDFSKDVKWGCSKEYDTLGNVVKELFFVNNVLQGNIVEYYPSGELKRTVQVEDGKEVGVAHEFSKDGVIITEEVFDNGFLKSREEYNRYDKEGRKTGIWREYFPDGSIRTEGNYSDGEKKGVFKEYNKKGRLVEINKMINDTTSMNPEDIVLIELYKEYYPSGKVRLKGGYANGMKKGIFREYSETGEVINGYLYEEDTMVAEGLVRPDGNYEGEWKHYYKTGELKAVGTYEDGVLTGKWTYYFKNGKTEQVGKYKENLHFGEWKWYFSNGQIRRLEYFNRKEKLEGLVTEWDSTGKEITNGEYYNGLREGSWFYHVGDYKEVGQYTIGLEDGLWTHYYLNGRIAFKGNYDEGEPKGKHIYYHDNGIKKKVGKYQAGEKNGIWRSYNRRGEEIETIDYKRGEIKKINGFKVQPIEEEV